MKFYTNRYNDYNLPLFIRESKYCKKLIPLEELYPIIKGESEYLVHKFTLFQEGVISKSGLPAVVVGGTCSEGDRCLITHMRETGLMALDVDEGSFNVEEVHDEFIGTSDELFEPILSFRSPSGKGLKWIIRPRYMLDQHNFSASLPYYCKYLVSKYRWPIAIKGQSNINRKTFLSLDPHVWVNQTINIKV